MKENAPLLSSTKKQNKTSPFLFTPWVLQGQVCATIDETASLTRCQLHSFLQSYSNPQHSLSFKNTWQPPYILKHSGRILKLNQIRNFCA